MPRSGLQVVTVRHVRIWIGHHYRYCMSMLACQYNQPKRPGDLDLLTLKVVSESRVTWATCVPIILVFLSLYVLELFPMMLSGVRQTDRRQTSDKRQTASSLNAPWAGA